MSKMMYKFVPPETLTYEQAVATAFLNVVNEGWSMRGYPLRSRLVERIYAMRRLRVRAGLVP